MDTLNHILQPQAEKRRNEKPFRASIIVTSDTCCKDESKDESGAYVLAELQNNRDLFSQVSKRCVEDDAKIIKDCLSSCLREEDPALVITIGGTGMTPRDVTPDAVSSLYHKHCTGIVVALHMNSLRYTPNAALSRLTAGIIGDCLVVNLPGSLAACRDNLNYLDSFLEHAIAQVRFNATAYNATHLMMQTTLGKMSGSSRRGSTQQAMSIDYGSLMHDSESIASSSKGSKGANAAPAGELEERVSRLSIKEVLESRFEHQQLKAAYQNKPASSVKKHFFHKRKFTSLDNLNHKPQSPMFRERKIVPSMRLIPTPAAPAPVFPTIPPTKLLVNHSNYPLIEFMNAHEILGAHSGDLLSDKEEVFLSTFEAAFKLNGRVLSQSLRSKKLVPAYAVSTMDGYAVHIPPKLRKAIGSITAAPPAKLLSSLSEFKQNQSHPQLAQTFFCIQINTGDRLPERNFAVVPCEKAGPVTPDGLVPISELRVGSYQRSAGSDLNYNDSLPAGTVIGPVELGLIIAMGHRSVEVFRRPKIGVLSTGDELVSFFPEKELGPEQVADTNGPLLASVFRSRGYYCFSLGICKDRPSEILQAMSEAIMKCDVLIVTGGASMGTKDHVKDVIQRMGGTMHFGRVNMKPGKPAAFASLPFGNKQKFIFSLPGNPVSAYITAMLLVLPFIQHGTKNHFAREGTLSLDCVGEFVSVVVTEIDGEPYEFDGRLEFIRAKITSPGPNYKAKVSMRQESSRMLSLLDYNCLIMIHPSKKGLKLQKDESYPAIKINRPL